jgi:hypothetical protein
VGFCVLRHHAEWFKSLLGKDGDGVRLWESLALSDEKLLGTAGFAEDSGLIPTLTRIGETRKLAHE